MLSGTAYPWPYDPARVDGWNAVWTGRDVSAAERGEPGVLARVGGWSAVWTGLDVRAAERGEPGVLAGTSHLTFMDT